MKLQQGFRITVLLIFYILPLLVGGCSSSGHSGYVKLFEVKAEKVSEDSHTRTFKIVVTNEEEYTMDVAAVLVRYYIEPSSESSSLIKYPLKVEAEPQGTLLLKPKESSDFLATFPKLKDLESNKNIKKDTVQIEVKAANIVENRPNIVYLGTGPIIVK